MKKIIIAASVLAAIYSCGKNECDAACDPLFPDVNFKIVNSTGQNLVTGPGKIYLTKNIQIKSLVNNTLVTDAIAFNGDTTLAATAIVFTANAAVSQYYLYINNVKTDSFQITYQATQGKTTCCPDYSAITSLKLNNTATSYTSPGNTTPVNVVK